MRKKLITGAAVLALLMNVPQVSADDDIVVFGGEFEDGSAPAAPKKVDKPAPKKPVEKSPSAPEVVKPQDKPPTQPIENPEDDEDNFDDVLIFDELTKIPHHRKNTPEEQPTVDNKPTAPLEQPTVDNKPTAPIEQPTVDKKPTAPIEKQPPVAPLPPAEINRPFEQPTKISDGQENLNEPVIIAPSTLEQPTEERPSRTSPSRSAAPQPNLKMLKPRFIKLAVDDTYTYYLDKTSVQWKKIPYLANEYMADVWVRMIEHSPAPLDDDMENYGAENFRAEVALAREKGYQYPPDDLKVLRSQAYILEHYYLRPKTHQIQFLCELEVFGRPQNAINERAYDNKNWENLVPGSIESAIYDATIKIIGKSKATGRGHMTFFDMLDEYGRIALN